VLEYYDRRAAEYDEWYLGAGLFADRERPGWAEERDRLCGVLAALPAVRTLDVACGTGFLTRHLAGEVTGLDQSGRMLAIARERMPAATFVRGDALALPFPGGAFHRVLTGHFYGHLRAGERERFLAEAARVADELVVVDSHQRPDHAAEEEQERVLNDGSRHRVYKRYFTAEGLAAELGGGEVLLDGDWFVAVRVATKHASRH
jgi:ubiquinone/menaquinone biosynthesis C-methylase UbiE